MAHPWPLFDLRLRTPRLELRLPTETDLPALLDSARAGIHDPADMPFSVPWTDAPSPELERNFYRWYWSTQAGCSPESWSLPFGVWVDGEAVGVQDLRAERFPELRVVWTASWLRRDRQGLGLGKEMRGAVLRLGFEHLGAGVATSEANLDNLASAGVSRALGYDDNGIGHHAPRGTRIETQRFRLTRERFEAFRAKRRYPEVEVDGLEPCLPLLGAR